MSALETLRAICDRWEDGGNVLAGWEEVTSALPALLAVATAAKAEVEDGYSFSTSTALTTALAELERSAP